MDCRTCQSLLAEYALGQLPADEWDRVSLHLETGCASCRDALWETNEAWAALVHTLPPAFVGERIGAALRERLALGYDEPDHAVAPGGRLTRRMLIAATLVVAAMVGLATWLSADRRKGLADPGYDLRQFEQEQRELQRATELFSNSRLHLASLRERDRASSASGYIVWDQLSRQIHVFGFDLQPPAEGRVFRIWLWRKGKPPQAVGILTPRADGTASTLATVPSDLRGAFRIGVVEGPPEAPPAPEGDPWLSSEVE